MGNYAYLCLRKQRQQTSEPMDTKTIANEILLGEVARLLAEGRSVTLRAKGNSMNPFIEGGKDLVKLVPADGIKAGDIALAETSAGRYVLHRVVKAEGDSVTLMGDGNLRGTERCRRADIRGKAALIVKPDGRAVDCTSRAELRKAAAWRRLLPLRRALLAVWRRLPGNADRAPKKEFRP